MRPVTSAFQSKSSASTPPEETAPKAGFHPICLPSHEAISRRAYDIYLQHGRPAGHASDHWFQAIRELVTEAIDSSGEPAGKTR